MNPLGFKTLDSIATLCSVKTYGGYLRCLPPPRSKVAICDLNPHIHAIRYKRTSSGGFPLDTACETAGYSITSKSTGGMGWAEAQIPPFAETETQVGRGAAGHQEVP